MRAETWAIGEDLDLQTTIQGVLHQDCQIGVQGQFAAGELQMPTPRSVHWSITPSRSMRRLVPRVPVGLDSIQKWTHSGWHLPVVSNQTKSRPAGRVTVVAVSCSSR